MCVGALNLVKISGISGSAVNGTRFVGSSHWKIPRKSGKSKKVGPFSRLEFPNGMSCSIYVSRSLYQFQVHGPARRCTGVTSKTKWNNFLPIGNSTLAPTSKFPGFFPKWKAPRVNLRIPNVTSPFHSLRNASKGGSEIIFCNQDAKIALGILKQHFRKDE